MNKQTLKYTLWLVLSFVLLVMLQLAQPKAIDFRPSFCGTDKIPYGTYILNDLRDSLFAPAKVYTMTSAAYIELESHNPPFVYPDTLEPEGGEFSDSTESDLTSNGSPDTSKAVVNIQTYAEPAVVSKIESSDSALVQNAPPDTSTFNYIYINDHFEPDELDVRELLIAAKHGSSIFIAARTFAQHFADTLKFMYRYNFSGLDDSTKTFSKPDSLQANFTSRSLRRVAPYKFRETFFSTFSRVDTPNTAVLGWSITASGKNEPNFIRTRFGKGSFYICTVPHAFTNYYLVSNMAADYAFKALSYLPKQDTYWDEYYKTGKEIIDSPLRYVLSQSPLQWAYYLVIAGLFLFVISFARRRQRIIPVILPLANTTLEFIETVGRLYFQTGAHKALAEKKITYFFAEIRSRFYLNQIDFTDAFYEALAAKSGVKRDDIKTLFSSIEQIQKAASISESTLIQFQSRLDAFFFNSSAPRYAGTATRLITFAERLRKLRDGSDAITDSLADTSLSKSD
jgi:ribosomal protein L20A (L18A)